MASTEITKVGIGGKIKLNYKFGMMGDYLY